jgi:hypothetical protein
MDGLSRFFNHDDEANMFIDEIPVEMEDYSSDGENLVEFGKKIKDAFANKKYSKKSEMTCSARLSGERRQKQAMSIQRILPR